MPLLGLLKLEFKTNTDPRLYRPPFVPIWKETLPIGSIDGRSIYFFLIT